MQVHMFAKEFFITPSLRDYMERRLRLSFTPALHRIENIDVRLRDLNGPRGGRDMLCQVAITIQGRVQVIVKETRDNMYDAIDHAIKRAAYKAISLVKQQRTAVRQAAARIAQVNKRLFRPNLAGEDTLAEELVADGAYRQ